MNKKSISRELYGSGVFSDKVLDYIDFLYVTHSSPMMGSLRKALLEDFHHQVPPAPFFSSCSAEWQENFVRWCDNFIVSCGYRINATNSKVDISQKSVLQ